MKTRSILIVLAVIFALGVTTSAAPAYATVIKPTIKFMKVPPRMALPHR